MSKGLKKEDLEQDILIEYSSRFMYFYEQNKAAVIGGGIGIVLIIGLIIGYFVYSHQQEQEAQNLLGIAEESFMQGNYESALYGDDDEFTLGFAQIADNYGRTDAGNLARYYAAVSEYEMGNYDEALNYIQNFDVPEGIMGVAPISLHATILTELNRYEEAGELFIRAAEWNQNNSTTPSNLLEAASAFREAGDREQALQQVNRILDEYPNSEQATEAKRLKGLLQTAE